MKFLPTWNERQELAQQRTARRQELLDQAATLRRQIAVQAHECAQIAADEPRTPPTERIAAQLDRLSAASDGQAQPSVRELHTELGERLGRWYRAGAGWWEARTVW